jgi:predicted enzyme related to lactoylglutathione lyase
MLPGSEVQMMLDVTESGDGCGPIFVVESVEAFHAGRPNGLVISQEPHQIPGGFMVSYVDSSGNPIYVLDQSLESGGAEAEASAQQGA